MKSFGAESRVIGLRGRFVEVAASEAARVEQGLALAGIPASRDLKWMEPFAPVLALAENIHRGRLDQDLPAQQAAARRLLASVVELRNVDDAFSNIALDAAYQRAIATRPKPTSSELRSLTERFSSEGPAAEQLRLVNATAKSLLVALDELKHPAGAFALLSAWDRFPAVAQQIVHRTPSSERRYLHAWLDRISREVLATDQAIREGSGTDAGGGTTLRGLGTSLTTVVRPGWQPSALRPELVFELTSSKHGQTEELERDVIDLLLQLEPAVERVGASVRTSEVANAFDQIWRARQTDALDEPTRKAILEVRQAQLDDPAIGGEGNVSAVIDALTVFYAFADPERSIRMLSALADSARGMSYRAQLAACGLEYLKDCSTLLEGDAAKQAAALRTKLAAMFEDVRRSL